MSHGTDERQKMMGVQTSSLPSRVGQAKPLTRHYSVVRSRSNNPSLCRAHDAAFRPAGFLQSGLANQSAGTTLGLPVTRTGEDPSAGGKSPSPQTTIGE